MAAERPIHMFESQTPVHRRPILWIALIVLGACSCGSGRTPTAATAPATSDASPVTTREDSMPDPPPTDPTPAEPDPTAAPEPPTPTDAHTPASSTDPEQGPAETGPSGTMNPTVRALSDIAVEDLAERRSVARDAVTVVAVEEVTWRDSSLGCPRKGMQYMQVLTPGVRVVLEVDGQRFFYHGTSPGDLTYCAAPQAPAPG